MKREGKSDGFARPSFPRKEKRGKGESPSPIVVGEESKGVNMY